MKKFLSASNIIACVSFILALIFVILYAVNINTNGYFQGVKANNLVLFAVLAMVLDLLILASVFIPLQGLAAKIVRVVVFVCKVLVPVFLVLAAMSLISARIEGLGYIFFSNVDVAKEVATPANIASATVAIAAVALGFASAIVSIVGSFFLPKEAEPVVE